MAFFITFCFVLSLEKMVTLTINIVYKKSAQYRKYLCCMLKLLKWNRNIKRNNRFFLAWCKLDQANEFCCLKLLQLGNLTKKGSVLQLEWGNFSREETINHFKVLTAETIQRRKLFKGGNYMRKYGNLSLFWKLHVTK